VLDAQRAVPAAQPGITPAAVLEPAEVRQHLLEAPARIAEPGPQVEFTAVATGIDLEVDRRAAPQGLATRPVQLPPAQAVLAAGGVTPVVGLFDRFGGGRGYRGLELAVGRPRLQQQHAAGRVGAEPAGQDTSSRARADHDVIEHLLPPLARPNGRTGELIRP